MIKVIYRMLTEGRDYQKKRSQESGIKKFEHYLDFSDGKFKDYLKIKLLEIRKYYPEWEYLEIGIDVDHFLPSMR